MIEPRGLSASRLALLGRELWAERGRLQEAEPLAVIGLGCRVPGADDPDAFWELLLEGRDEVREVPPDRWEAERWYDPDPATPGRASTRWGGFLGEVRGFDAAFFGISPSEAERMDPQQRLALEVTWEALERAGIPTGRLEGTPTGVFFAAYHHDYAQMQYADPASITARTLTGTLHSVLANRISFLLGLHGPSLAVDTACSSSLVAVHLARRSLLSRDCDLAIAGGVSLMLHPPMMVALSKGGFMSPTGRCHTFDAAADGFVRGEGCGVVVLRRLSDAIERGEPVLAVLRGSAVNQDGVSSTLSAPNGAAHAALIRRALAGAGIDPAAVSMIEAHGTGTRLGDPIETDALAEVFADADRADPLWLGSVKANLGHLEAAAGVTGMIKAVLALRHRTIPPQPHYRTRNPLIDLEGTPLRIPETSHPWSPPGPRIVGVSSFGVGGTNGHVVLEEAPDALRPAEDETAAAGPWVLPLSARSAEALDALTDAVSEQLERGVPPGRLARAAARARTHHRPYRRAVVGFDAQELRDALHAMRAETPAAGDERPRLAFAYAGQGTQWAGMGLGLAEAEPVFAAMLERVDAAVRVRGGPPLLDELARPRGASRLQRTDLAQLGVFAVQLALTELLRSWGIRPDAVVGHSIGEVAAAWSSGFLDFEAAVDAVWARAKTMQEHSGPGAMLWLPTDVARAAALIDRHPAVAIAAMNGPTSTVVAGPADALAALFAEAGAAGIDARRLEVEYAFHSPAMDEAAARLRADPPLPRRGEGVGRWYSTVDGRPVEELAPGWLADNVRSPVRFAAAVAAMAADGVRHFIELGPRPVLGTDMVATLQGDGLEARIAYAMDDRKHPATAPRALLARLHGWGYDPDWDAIDPGPIDPDGLPTYPWQRREYWLPPAVERRASVGDPRGGRFPGVPLESPALDGWVWALDPGHPAFGPLTDHRIDGRARMPATAIAELCRAAGEGAGLDGVEVRGLVFLMPVELTSDAPIQTVVPADRSGCRVMQKAADGQWQIVARADFEHAPGAVEGGSAAPAAAPAATEGEAWEAARLDALLEGAGADFGPAFRRIELLTVAPGSAEGVVGEGAGWPGSVDPGAVDAVAQLCMAVLAEREALFLPFALDRYRVVAPLPEGPLRGRVRVTTDSTETPGFDLRLEDAAGRLLVEIEGWRLRRHVATTAVMVPEWRAEEVRTPETPGDPAASRALAGGRWIVIGNGAVADAVAERLAAEGATEVARSVAQTLETEAHLAGVVLCAGIEGPDTPDTPVGAPDADLHWMWAQAMRRCAAEPSGALRVAVVTRGAQDPPPAGRGSDPAGGVALGLARALRSERRDLAVRTIDLDPAPAAVDPTLHAERIVQELRDARPDDGVEVALRLEARWVRRPAELRARAAAPLATVPLRLRHRSPGWLDRFEVVEGEAPPHPGAGEVVVRVDAAGINFRDVLAALAVVDGSPDAGQECAGRVVAVGPGVRRVAVGDPVVAFHPGGFGSLLVAPEAALWALPREMDPVGGATLPVVFGTAWVALHELGGLQAGDAVLIHGGAGGVGMAAIRLALARGARVFATAGSPARRERLEAMGVEGAFDSRSTAFADDVLVATDGEGVAVVVNSLTGEAIAAGIRVLRPGGRFIELGKREILGEDEVRALRDDVVYRPFDLRTLVDADPALARRLGDGWRAGLEQGTLSPLPAAVFPLAEAGAAYRRMSRGDHLGKLVLRPPPDPVDLAGAGWAVVVGGSGAVGRATVRWLLEGGRRHIAVVGRRPLPPADPLRAAAAEAGADLRSLVADVADRRALEEVLATLRAEHPLTFIVHSAGVVHDGVLTGLERDDFERVTAPKIHGAWNLHHATLADPVDAFLVYSAAGPWLDAAGMGAYAAANGYLEALVLHRRALGRPAAVVVWGPWEGGMAAALDERHRERWAERGAGTWEEAGARAVLTGILRTDAAVVLAVRGVEERRGAEVRADHGEAGAPELRTALGKVAPGEAASVAIEHVAGVLRRLLGRSDIDPEMPLRDLGLDSLGAIELRNTLTRSIGISLPATVAFDHPTAGALAAHLVALVVPSAVGDEASSPLTGADVDAVAALDEDEALRLLIEELEVGG